MAPKTMSRTPNNPEARGLRNRPPTWPPRRTSRRFAYARHRSALTLLEMVLVLAVMVAVSALVLPAMQGPMNDQRLRKSGDLVLAQWSKARLAAMKTGRMHMFRYETGSDRYQVQSCYDQVDGVETSADPSLPLPAAGSDSQLVRDAPLGVAGVRLPDGITFLLGTTDMDSRSMQMQGESATASDALAAPPIVFYPDGSTSNARLVLTNSRFCVELKLRGLTGLGRSSELLAIEEITP